MKNRWSRRLRRFFLEIIVKIAGENYNPDSNDKFDLDFLVENRNTLLTYNII